MTTKEAINHFGTKRQLAEAIGIWPHSIFRWGEYPPLARQYELEIKSGGALRAEAANVKN